MLGAPAVRHRAGYLDEPAKNYGLRVAKEKIGDAPKKISEHHGKKVKAINELCA
jgi:hypothetical protein